MTKVISWLIVLLMLINPCFSNVVKAEQEERFQQYEDDEFYIALEKGYGKLTFGDIGAQYERGRTSTGGDFNDNRKMAETQFIDIGVTRLE